MRKNLIIGLGEVGNALKEILESNNNFEIAGRDIRSDLCFGEMLNPDIINICIPWSPNFEGIVVDNIETLQPSLAIIHSTVPIGTTRRISEKTSFSIVHSPVRGMHGRKIPFKDYMMQFPKYIGAIDDIDYDIAALHFKKCGFKISEYCTPEETEFMKIKSLCYYGLLITWAKEINDICEKYELDYEKVMEFSREARFVYTPESGHGEKGMRPVLEPMPGKIGGHCVIPGCEHLLRTEESKLVVAILADNEER